MHRRDFNLAALASLLAAQGLAATSAQAQAPSLGKLKVMVPANPGGGWDQTGRSLAVAMQAAGVISGAQFENKGGAGGTLGLSQFINNAKGDGSALMLGGMVMVGGIMLSKSTVDLTMVTPIARLTSEYVVIVVPSSSPHKNLGDLMKAFKANPGSVSWGGGSAGGTDHILVGLAAQAIGADTAKINYVPFKGGGEAIAAIIGGHVTAGVSGLGEFAEQIKGGRMRALGVSGPEPIDGIPSLKENGVDVVLGNWRGCFGGPGLTPAQRDALVSAVKAATETKEWQETLAKLGWTPWFLGGDDYKKFLDEDIKRVAGILESLGLIKKA
jgi:putative tricarboxylic transport membrane protein